MTLLAGVINMAEDHIPIETRDFRTIGMAWTVRHRDGRRTRHFTLKSFLAARDAGDIVDDDALSSDGVTWRRVGRIEDFHQMFKEAWTLGADENASVLQVGLNDSLITDQPSLRLKFVPLDKNTPAPAPTPAPASSLSGSLASAPPPSPVVARAPAPVPAPEGKSLSQQTTLLALAAAAGIGAAIVVVTGVLLVLFWRGGGWG